MPSDPVIPQTPTAPTAPPENAPTAAPTDAEIEAMFGPRKKRFTGLWDYLRAAYMAGSFGFLLVGFLFIADEVLDLINIRDRHLVFIVPIIGLASLLLGIWKGFAAQSKGAFDTIARIIFILFFGTLLGGLCFILLALIHDAFRPGDMGMGILWMGIAILLFSSSLRFSARARRALKQDPLRIAAPPPPIPGTKLLRAYFWGGLFSATLIMWGISLMILVHRNGIFNIPSSKRAGFVLFIVIISLFIGASRAFPIEFRKHTHYLMRLFINVLCTALGGLFYLALSFPFLAVYDPSERKMAEALSLLAVPMIGLGLWLGRHIENEGLKGRVEAGFWGVLVVIATLYPQSAWVRYAFGSAEGAEALAAELYSNEEYARAASYAETACLRDDYNSCAMAAHIYRMGLGVPASLKRARAIIAESCMEPEDCAALAQRVSFDQTADLFLERACELGDRSSCRLLTTVMLSARCSGKDAFACRELALSSERQSQTWRAREFYQKACQFGDTLSCTHPSLR